MDENMNRPQEQAGVQPPKSEHVVPSRSQRKRRSKQELFKENTLPFLIMAIAALLIVIFIIGSITRAVQKKHIENEASIAMSEAIAAEELRLNAEMEDLLARAEVMAASYDYDGAIALINSFSGNIGGYPQLQDAQAKYEYSKQLLVPWDDPATIQNLSFNSLICDTGRAFYDDEFGSAMKKNFVTLAEFRTILERLYENDYVLVTINDFIEVTTSESGITAYNYKELYLPEGKKPLVLTQTNLSYNLYLVDGDGDMVADKDGIGIASKMLLDSDGNVVCEFINTDGSTVTGEYDLVPILDAFVKEHPDFSYRGAKAVLALTGYNGLFGYRTHPDGRMTFGEEEYEKNVATIQSIANALTNSGYELACYTYANESYGTFSVSQIQSDISKWLEQVVPILGNIDTLVLAQNSDIGSGMLYSGEKFDYLKSAGFNYFIGYCSEGNPFTFIADDYVRQGRLTVSGGIIADHADWFNGIMETDGILEESRNTAQ